MTTRGRRARARELELLARLARLATEDLELRPMMQRVTDALVEELGWELVALVRVDAAARRFVCEACTSRVETDVHPGYSRPFGSGVVGRVAASGEPVVIDDVTTFADFVDTRGGISSELCAPIRHRGEVLAVLNLESPRPAAFRGALPLVEAIAGQLAGPVASARHLEEVGRRAAILDTLAAVTRAALEAQDLDRALARIASFLRDRLDFHLVAIVVADEGHREWSHRAFALREPAALQTPERWPVDRGVVGRAIRSGSEQLVLDVAADPDYFAVDDRVVCELVAPIVFEGRALGAINVESDRAGVFTAELRELVALVAAQVAGAIRLALLNRRLSEATRLLSTANAELERLSLVDALTGIANRRRFDAALALEWRRQLRASRSLALVLLDVDCFKAYNDSLGHPAGDACLQRFGALLAGKVKRAGDLAARFGGEEFAVLLHDADLETARSFVEALRGEILHLAIPHPASPVAPVVTASFGAAAAVPTRDDGAEGLVRAADAALYLAKQSGRNRLALAASGDD
ncbi:MAG TPA: diguanylate cyclase [Thermoanaerobaculia bacterium]|jgi:diguanylate cyclase (GGDEF)-like protein